MSWNGDGWSGPHRDAENEPAEPDLTAFNTDDVHGYFELGRRIRNTAVFVGIIAVLSTAIILTWRLT